jgi:hypothetical protein
LETPQFEKSSRYEVPRRFEESEARYQQGFSPAAVRN